MKKILVVDGNSIINRAFYGIRLLRANNGKYTNAIYGMINIISRQLESLKPEVAAVAFDRKEPTFRHRMYANYKAGRHPTPPELSAQFPDAKECLSAMGLSVLELPGWEADDIQGTVAHLTDNEPNAHAYILSGDRDLLQLVSEKITVILAGNQEQQIFDIPHFYEKYGINPSQFVDVKALMGDSSDNIPGVPGVGEKTALRLIAEFGTLDGVFCALESAEPLSPEREKLFSPSLRRKLTEGKESAFLSQKLCTICCAVPMDLSCASLCYHGIDNDRLYRKFVELELGSFIRKFSLTTPKTESITASLTKPGEAEQAPLSTVPKTRTAIPIAYTNEPIEALNDMTPIEDDSYFDIPSHQSIKKEDSAVPEKRKRKENGTFSETGTEKESSNTTEVINIKKNGTPLSSYAIEVDELLNETVMEEDEIKAFPNRLSIVQKAEGLFFYAPAFGTRFFPFEQLSGTDKEASRNAFSSLFDGTRELVCYDSKALWHLLKRYGISLSSVPRDVMLEGYLWRGGDGQVNLSALALSALGVVLSDKQNEARLLWQLDEVLSVEIDRLGMTNLLEKIELPLAPILAEMEDTGFLLDREGMTAYGRELSEEMESLADLIYTEAGHPFNLNSPKQLGEVLFTELGLPTQKKTKSGFSTNAETLEKLRYNHPIVDHILAYRQVAKLFSTYAVGLVSASDAFGRIHTDFKQALTATGRLSSTEPNLQNIPVRTKAGERMRRYFIADKGNVLVDADYSQIELRLLAQLSGDKRMQKAFFDGADIHTETAATVFGVSRESVTPELRKRAKAVNFGIVYGIGAHSLSQDLGISQRQAKTYIESYLASYPGIDDYLKQTVAEAEENGFTTTFYGRRRYIPELKNSKASVRAFGKRVAMNSPIQGTAADIMKLATIRVYHRLKTAVPQANLVMQVHDELIVEAPRELAEKVADILVFEMQHTVSFEVPLTAAAGIAENWLKAK